MNETEINFPESVAHLLANFDFARVEKMMNAVDWKWHDSDKPDRWGLVDLAMQLFRDLLSRPDEKSLATGGLRVSRFTGEVGAEAFELEFIGESSASE